MELKNRKLLALCSAAVLCVASYNGMETLCSNRADANATVPTYHATSTKQTTSSRSSTPDKSASAVKTSTGTKTTSGNQTTSSKSTTKANSTRAKKQKYKDGTYTGSGQTRIGAVQVAVTLKADKITNVQITGYTTHYSISYIDPLLPQELLKRQDVTKIDVVSGATLSTYDFYYAVQDALQQAQRAETSVISKS